MSPRADPEARRREIMEAGMRCFARSGYAGTSMDDIVAETGLSKGTLYWYFQNKQALFAAMLEALIADLAGSFQQVIAQDAPVSERLRALAVLFWQMMVEQGELGDLLVAFWAESKRDEAFNTTFRRLFEPYIDMLAGLIEEGIHKGEFRRVPARAVASAFAAIMDGLWIQAMIGLPIQDYMEPEALVDWMLKGLLPR